MSKTPTPQELEMEAASVADVLNQELRVIGPIEVEQYRPSQMREGIRKLCDYFNDKIDRREAALAAMTKERDEQSARADRWTINEGFARKAVGELKDSLARAEKALCVRRDEFFHDGLSADLAEGDITTVEDAYVEGYRDAEDEVVIRIREAIAARAKETKNG